MHTTMAPQPSRQVKSLRDPVTRPSSSPKNPHAIDDARELERVNKLRRRRGENEIPIPENSTRVNKIPVWAEKTIHNARRGTGHQHASPSIPPSSMTLPKD
jgi:hypothetical protein